MRVAGGGRLLTGSASAIDCSWVFGVVKKKTKNTSDIREGRRNETYGILSFKRSSPIKSARLPQPGERTLFAWIWSHPSLLHGDLVTGSRWRAAPGKSAWEIGLSCGCQLASPVSLAIRTQRDHGRASWRFSGSQDNEKCFLTAGSAEKQCSGRK